MKRIIRALLFLHLLCTFPAGHTVAPLFIWEPVLLTGFLTEPSFHSSELSLYGLFSILLGQGILIFGLFSKRPELISFSGKLGSLLLFLSIIFIHYSLSEQYATLTGITSLPFVYFALKFWLRLKAGSDNLQL